MDSTNQIPNTTSTPDLPNELQRLKEKAKTLGVTHSGNIGVDALRAKINAKMEGLPEPKDESDADLDLAAVAATGKKIETVNETRKRLEESQMALVRCRIYNLNPNKRDLHGEIVTVGNKYLGTVKKFIPFGEATEGGYHIPQILLTELQSRKFQDIRPIKKNGQIEVKTRVVPEYNIEILPPLTAAELAELAAKQGAAERLGA